ncbi:glycosyltransferase family 2 protein [filamentous cyanobacterium LEGE 11480]|uniref:Glycosyltransferase family 2 protein n=1 Tax=Romeriopsis navalis LEGE 11480 TaxID=2777977 RepID=A0A928VMZ5_9CYAN|nr:glycosyltransferase family A protein [Romeriopsis navalis]MBE9031290.1 glycosyltransferase family 2 protein [Romeriopsis navalis LEGE 11480]
MNVVLLDITKPIVDIRLPPGRAPHATLQVQFAGQHLGDIRLPTVDQIVTAARIRGALVAEFTSPILVRLLATASPWQSRAQIAANLDQHFLQAIWGQPHWSLAQFYDAAAAAADTADATGPTIDVATGWLDLEATEPLPYLHILNGHLRVSLSLAGQRVGAISWGNLDATGTRITPQQLRVAFTQSYRLELQRACVRSLLGKPLQAGQSMRQQLQGGRPVSDCPDIHVSIIVPAYNAASYLAQCLQSVLAQTYAHWELILVDDGSSDATPAIAADFAQRDSRIRIVHQANQGGCAARNYGASLAHFGWLAFLDADDWWEPTYLAAMTQLAVRDPSLDAVRCSWSRVTATGEVIETFLATSQQPAFRTCVLECGFQMDSCMVRRSVVEAIQGFDLSLKAGQDWDFWQRIARTGARFGIVEAVLSYYRTVPGSVSADGMRLLEYSLLAIERGHNPDPRVLNPDPRYAMGLDHSTLAAKRFHFVLWCVGLAMVQGQDPMPLLAQAPRHVVPSPTPESISDYLKSVVYRSGEAPTAWPQIWAEKFEVIQQFVQAVGAHLAVEPRDRFIQQTFARLEYKLLHDATAQSAQAYLPMTLGRTYACWVDITAPLPDIAVNADRLFCVVYCGDEHLGNLELPLCEGQFAADILADAIAGEYFWVILQRFFARYDDTAEAAKNYDAMGWEQFLQSLFEQPNWEAAWFYDPDRILPIQTHTATINHPEPSYQIQRYLHQARTTIEISQEMPTLIVNPALSAESVSVVLTVAGKILGRISVSVVDQRVSAAVLRSTLLAETHAEICRVVVREALVGRVWAAPMTLRARLQSVFVAQPSAMASVAPIASCWRSCIPASDLA